MTLADDVAELEENYDNLKSEVRVLEESLDEVEMELEDVTNQLTKFKEFRTWAELVYPEIVRDYESVKVIEEVANGV
jgi:predicted  nucleic acid-binding Zn-ribbon protein